MKKGRIINPFTGAQVTQVSTNTKAIKAVATDLIALNQRLNGLVNCLVSYFRGGYIHVTKTEDGTPKLVWGEEAEKMKAETYKTKDNDGHSLCPACESLGVSSLLDHCDGTWTASISCIEPECGHLVKGTASSPETAISEAWKRWEVER